MVTLLLSAYPGHIDFEEKRNLLNDIEMIHGSSLAVSEDAPAVDNTICHKSRSRVNNRNKQRTHNRENKRMMNGSAPLEQDDGSNFNSPFQPRGQKVESRDPRASSNVAPSAPRMAQVVSVHNSRSTHSPVRPTAPTVPRAEAVKISRRVNSHKKRNPQVPAHKFNDLPSSEHRRSVEPMIEASAPALSEVQQSFMESTKIRESATDFPDVELFQSVEIESETMRYPTATRSRRSSRNRRKGLMVGTEQDKNPECHGYKESFDREPEATERFEISRQGELKSPLGRSRLENSGYSTPNKTGKIQKDPQRTENIQNLSHAKEISSNWFEADFSSFEQKTTIKKEKPIEKTANEKENPVENLEAKLKKALKEKKALEQICSQLERENAELKTAVREAGRKALQSKWTNQDEEDFLASRRLRHEAQRKIKHPIHEHLERVNYIYEIKNQCFMTNKRHFSLSVPDHFQRAPVLDIRDRNNENTEDTENYKFAAKEANKTDENSVKNTAFKNVRASLTPPPRLTPPKKVQPPAGLSALRRLTGKK